MYPLLTEPLLLSRSSFILLLFWLHYALGADINAVPMLLPPESDMDVNRSPASVSILGTWHVLGPFKTGTRGK